MEKLTREIEKLTREQVIERINKGYKDFSNLDLSGLDLSNLDLNKANLSCCNLFNTNLFNTNLFNGILCNSKLLNTNLCCAYLESANLENAVLSNVDLTNTRLDYANLSYANLFDCNLEKTNLESVNLFRTRLDEKEKIRKGIILKESMIGYKRCIDRIIVTLEIPKGAIVFSINNNKCRTNKAKVVEISNGETIAKSRYDENFIYELGQEIEIEDFDLMYNVECSSGIHFFRTREEAENY